MRGHVGRSRLLNGRATRNVSGFPNSVDSNCATKNHPVRLGSRNPSFRSKPVSSTLLPISGRRPREIDGRARNRRAPRFRVNALASRPQTEITRSRLRRAYGVLRPKLESTDCARGGLPASIWVGQMRDVAECQANRRRGLAGLSPCFRIGRIEIPRAPKGLWFTVREAEMRELISNRGASGEIRTVRRPRNAEDSGDESRFMSCGTDDISAASSANCRRTVRYCASRLGRLRRESACVPNLEPEEPSCVSRSTFRNPRASDIRSRVRARHATGLHSRQRHAQP
jgi:hypothetical protein